LQQVIDITNICSVPMDTHIQPNLDSNVQSNPLASNHQD
jgi:hypothetical protein